MKKYILFLIILTLIITGCSKTKEDVIKIGVIAELTGDVPAFGASCKNSVLMAAKEINDTGGLEVSGKKYKIQLFIEDNAARPEQSASVAQKLITQDNVVAILGPNASGGAIPASEIAESSKIPFITPISTNPKTTIDPRSGLPKKFAFRVCYLDPFQGQVLATFALNNLKAKRAAVLFDVTSEVLKGQAEYFKKSFEAQGGTIAAFETYSTGDRDFSTQFTKIKNAAPDIIFLPSYYGEVPLQIQQAKRLGITVPFLGSDAWGSHDLLKLCGPDCEGYYFCSHYASDSTAPLTVDFVNKYKKMYGVVPDDVAALTYDGFQILLNAVKKSGKINPQAIRDAISNTKDYKGITGNITYTKDSGDPIKGAVIIQIKNGDFKWFSDEATSRGSAP
ncbi:MAG: ABC transporter substrate-binding protein [Nitrospirae bacterium]|nr:ABC transporter substrate-binding protein [Nitrospirota bacterium]